MCTYLESYSLVSISASRTLISTRFPFTRLRLLSPVRFLFSSNILFFIYWKFAAATTSSKLFWSLSTGKSLSISHPKYCIAKPLETNIRTIAPEHWLFSVCVLEEKKLSPIPNVYNKTSNCSNHSVLFIRSSTNRQICKSEDWACARPWACVIPQCQYSRY